VSTIILGEQFLTRSDLQTLARRRLKEAKVLLDNRCYEGSFYLLGYAVECAVKACIAKQMRKGHFPPTRGFVDTCYIHDLERLFKTAELWTSFQADLNANAALRCNWQLIKPWNEAKRYDPGRLTKAVAEGAYQGVADPVNRVFQWLRLRW
jgi:hypothetical protein